MKKEEYEKMQMLEDSHFWFVGKRYFIETYLRKINSQLSKILDVGSGTGGATKYLSKFGAVTGVETNSFAIKMARQRGLKIIKGEVEKLPFKKNAFDLVTVFDVLYHKNVKNVNLAISEIRRVLKIRGYLLITDSAFRSLSGKHSKSVAEARRFTIAELKDILHKNSSEIISSSYIFFLLFPLIFLKRNFLDRTSTQQQSDVFSINKLANGLIKKLLRLESWLLSYIKFPVGSSLIILAKKRN